MTSPPGDSPHSGDSANPVGRWRTVTQSVGAVDKRKRRVRHGMVKEPARILVVGGGYVGMYTALRLQRRLKRELDRGEVEITVVTPDPYMTYQPFLPEAAAGSISPRHVVVPLRRVLDRCHVVIGEVRTIDHTG